MCVPALVLAPSLQGYPGHTDKGCSVLPVVLLARAGCPLTLAFPFLCPSLCPSFSLQLSLSFSLCLSPFPSFLNRASTPQTVLLLKPQTFQQTFFLLLLSFTSRPFGLCPSFSLSQSLCLSLSLPLSLFLPSFPSLLLPSSFVAVRLLVVVSVSELFGFNLKTFKLCLN